MSKELAFPDTIKSIINQPSTPSCSLTTPNSILDGCTDAMKAAATDPGALGVGAIGVSAAALNATNKSAIGAAAQAIGLEGAAACAYGAINTAVDNCNATNPNKSIETPPVAADPVHTPDATLDLIGNTEINH